MREGIYILAFIVISLGIALFIRSTIDSGKGKEKVQTDKKDKKDKKKKNNDEEAIGSDVTIVQTYELPDILKEVSAIVYMDKNRFACVQDELGKVFIYNTSDGKIEKEIPFAAAGDYEGLAIAGETAFVLKADGKIFEIKNFSGAKPAVVEHNTHLTAKHDTEGLCYDSKNNRLLVSIKGSETGNPDYKGIYAFDLKTNKMDKSPVYKIDLNDEIFQNAKSKKAGSAIQPSAIAVHPKTGDIYLIDASKARLLIMDESGKIKSLKSLGNKDFNQPEGITFSPEGKLYISNEGSKEPGNILELGEL